MKLLKMEYGKIFIPMGGMCLVCINLHRKCNHLPFNEYSPMGKKDDEGYVVVRCGEFHKRIGDIG